MMNRRQFLHLAAGGAAGLVTGGLGSLVNLQPAAARTKPDPKFVPDLDIALKATPGEVHILPGNPTSVWHYQGQLLKGDRANLIHLERSYLGPIIRVHRGQKIRIRFTNNIPAETIVHWHGLHVPALMDGHPRLVIPRGETYIYEFEVCNRAGTYWYHPHPHGRTGHQVYGGMAGFFLVSDDEEKSAGLPGGEYDIPLVIQDRTFDNNNQFIYISGHPMERMPGFFGGQDSYQWPAGLYPSGSHPTLPPADSKRLQLADLQACLAGRQPHDIDRHRRRHDGLWHSPP